MNQDMDFLSLDGDQGDEELMIAYKLYFSFEELVDYG